MEEVISVFVREKGWVMEGKEESLDGAVTTSSEQGRALQEVPAVPPNAKNNRWKELIKIMEEHRKDTQLLRKDIQDLCEKMDSYSNEFNQRFEEETELRQGGDRKTGENIVQLENVTLQQSQDVKESCFRENEELKAEMNQNYSTFEGRVIKSAHEVEERVLKMELPVRRPIVEEGEGPTFAGTMEVGDDLMRVEACEKSQRRSNQPSNWPRKNLSRPQRGETYDDLIREEAWEKAHRRSNQPSNRPRKNLSRPRGGLPYHDLMREEACENAQRRSNQPSKRLRKNLSRPRGGSPYLPPHPPFVCTPSCQIPPPTNFLCLEKRWEKRKRQFEHIVSTPRVPPLRDKSVKSCGSS